MVGDEVHLVVGSFAMPDGPDGDGLRVFALDRRSGTLEPTWSGSPRLNVGGVAIRDDVLYVTDEVDTAARAGLSDGGGGRIYAFRIDRQGGRLAEIAHGPSFGTQPAGIAIDPCSASAVVVHFTSRDAVTRITGDRRSGFGVEIVLEDATTVLFPLEPDGSLGAPVDIDVRPPGPDGAACLHSVTPAPDGSCFVVCDMARDVVRTIGIDRAESAFVALAERSAPEGSGPRYAVFHPTLPVFAVNHEYLPIVQTFSWTSDGAFHLLGTVDVLPTGTPARADALQSDLRVHPSGRWLYTLVRGHEVLSVLALDERTGVATLQQTVAVDGVGLKGCAVSPDGRQLFVAASRSDAVIRFAIADDGTVGAELDRTAVPSPGVLAFIPDVTR